MKKTSWIILKSKDRGIDYGVGTFIKQLSHGFAVRKEINVFVLEIGITGSKSFTIRKQDGITILEIPLEENTKGVDSKKNQEKLSRNISRVVSQYIPKCDVTVIHMNYLFQYFIGIELRRVLKGNLIFTQHVFTLDEKVGNNFFDTENHTYQLVDKIITVTKHGKDHLVKKGVEASKIEVIYNGIDPVHFNTKNNDILKKYGIELNEKIILYSGRIDPIKGLDYLFDSFELLLEKIPGCRLVIAGNGNFESLIKKARKFSANISYLGFIPFEDVVALYHEADIGVIPSLEEHCSYVALEMMHYGLPVVASNLGGLKEIFVHGENALLANTIADKTNMYGVSPEVNQLTNHMHKLLSDEKLRTDFSRNAIIRANEKFTLDIMITNYIQTIKNLN
jgi:glycosyltransferase involved in cell wall biosynthesis